MKFVPTSVLKLATICLALMTLTNPVFAEEDDSLLNEELVEDDLVNEQEQESLDAEVEEQSVDDEEDEDLLEDEGDDDEEEDDEVIMHKGTPVPPF